jgi:hypothetical protein
MSDVAERVKKIVVEHLGVDEAKVTENASFIVRSSICSIEAECLGGAAPGARGASGNSTPRPRPARGRTG